jgi:glycosyl transferase family 25
MHTSVRVISLPYAHERRARFAASAPLESEVDWSFFDASTTIAEGITYSRARALVSHGRELRAGEIGCFVSHYRLWNAFLASGAEQMLVLEDDVFVDWAAVRPMLDVAFPRGIDYVRLYAMRPAPLREIGWFLGRRLVQFLHYAYGTQAYVVTRAGARRFVAAATGIERPIDDFMDRAWDHGVPNLALFPFPVLELAGSSSIGGVERHAKPSLSPRQTVRRLAYRVGDKLLRLGYEARERSLAAGVRRHALSGITAQEGSPPDRRQSSLAIASSPRR